MHAAHAKQKKHAAALKEGDRVAFSALFLKSIHASHDIAKLRGVIVKLTGTYPTGMTNSQGDDLTGETISENFAVVQWDNIPQLKIVARFNLAKLKSVAFSEAP